MSNFVKKHLCCVLLRYEKSTDFELGVELASGSWIGSI